MSYESSRPSLHRRALVLAAALTLSAPPLAAQQTSTSGAVVGTVRAPSGDPLGDVAVYAVGLRRGAMTDAAGRFRIAELPAGEVRLVAQRVGLRADTAIVQVAPDSTTTVELRLAEEATIITPVIVSATREVQRRDEASATIDVVDAAEVRRTRAAHPAGIMNRIPGVHVSELSGEGHSMAMRQPITTKPMYLYLEDGVPTRATGFFNHNALYEVNIPQSGGIEVLKGPGTALYGSDAIGGVVNVLTRPAPLAPSGEASVEGGGHGYARLLASGGSTWGRNGLRVDLNVTHSDNWKDKAPFDRQSATARWDWVGASGWTVKTVATGSNIDQHDVPTLTSQQYASTPSLNRAPIAFRTVQALRVSSAIERDAGRTSWSVTPYARWNTMGLIPSWQLTYDPQVWDTRSASLGLLVKHRRDWTPLSSRLIVGVDGDVTPGSFTADRVVSTPAGGVWSSYTKGARQYDYDVTYRGVSPYAHGEITPAPRLKIDAGLRADLVGYDYHTRLAPLDTGTHRVPADTRVSYTHLSPKLGVTYEASEAAAFFASYRHGFRAPSQGQLFQQNGAANTVDLAPVKVESFEVGMRGNVAGRMLYSVSAYDMVIHDDIVTFTTAQNTREATNAGRTRHRGVEIGSGLAVTPTLRVDASYAVSRQRYVDWTPQAATATKPAVSYSGKMIEQAPRELASALVAWSPRRLGGGRMSAEWSHTGGYFTDPGDTHYYRGYDLLGLSASAVVRHGTELFARVSNVLDTRYAELVAWDAFQKDQFTPGAPRTFYTGVRVALGGGR